VKFLPAFPAAEDLIDGLLFVRVLADGTGAISILLLPSAVSDSASVAAEPLAERWLWSALSIGPRVRRERALTLNAQELSGFELDVAFSAGHQRPCSFARFSNNFIDL
jgi:hypothetical protein